MPRHQRVGRDKVSISLRILRPKRLTFSARRLRINNPNEFRVRKSVRRRGRPTTEWVPMRKGVAYLFRYRDISHSANSRYLDALAVVDDPSTQVRELDRLTRRRQSPTGRTAKAFNPLAREELHLFHAIVDGANSLRGFTNRDIRTRLQYTSHLTPQRGDPHRESAKVSRILHRFHAHGLIAKIPVLIAGAPHDSGTE